jgi:hypothetical protein
VSINTAKHWVMSIFESCRINLLATSKILPVHPLAFVLIKCAFKHIVLTATSAVIHSTYLDTMPHMVSQIFEVLWCRRFWSDCIVPYMYFVRLDVLSLTEYMP